MVNDGAILYSFIIIGADVCYVGCLERVYRKLVRYNSTPFLELHVLSLEGMGLLFIGLI